MVISASTLTKLALVVGGIGTTVALSAAGGTVLGEAALQQMEKHAPNAVVAETPEPKPTPTRDPCPACGLG